MTRAEAEALERDAALRLAAEFTADAVIDNRITTDAHAGAREILAILAEGDA